jgi:hypothetical protein
MERNKNKTGNMAAFFLFIFVLCVPMAISRFVIAAPTYCSETKCIDEYSTGPGGLVNACSTNYCSNASLGDTGIGNSSSANYQAYGGYTTTGDPYIELVTPNSLTDIGTLSSSSTSTATATFSVRAYLANGYTVINGSDAPSASSNGNTHFLTALTVPTSPSTNTEQFGINLVANTNPSAVGSDPVQIPSSQFAFGTVASGYNTPNLYKYVKGDIIASSSQSTSYTKYTVTYMYNISAVTPSGFYTFNHGLVATGTY